MTLYGHNHNMELESRYGKKNHQNKPNRDEVVFMAILNKIFWYINWSESS